MISYANDAKQVMVCLNINSLNGLWVYFNGAHSELRVHFKEMETDRDYVTLAYGKAEDIRDAFNNLIERLDTTPRKVSGNVLK